MKKLLILPLIIVAAGCGSQTKTVTSPPKTVTITKVDKTASISGSACKQAMEMLINMESKTIDSASAMLHFKYAKGTKLIDQVNAKFPVLKPLVNLCRMG